MYQRNLLLATFVATALTVYGIETLSHFAI